MREKAKTRRAEALAKAKERGSEAREKAQARHAEWKEKAMARRAEAKEKSKVKRDEFKAKHTEWKEKCHDASTDDCKALRKTLRGAARQHLRENAATILANLKAQKEEIEANEELSDEEKTEAVAEIDEEIAEVEEEETALESESIDESDEAVNERAEKLKAKWMHAKKKLIRNKAKLANARIKGVAQRATVMQEKLDRAIAKLAEKGVDTSSLDAQLAEFSAALDNAEKEYNAAKALIEEAKGEEVRKDLPRDVETHLKAAREYVKQAHDIAKELVKNIRTAAKGEVPRYEEEATEVTTSTETATSTEGSTSTETASTVAAETTSTETSTSTTTASS